MPYPTWKENGKTKLMIIVGTRPEIIRLVKIIQSYVGVVNKMVWRKDV